MLVCLTSNHRTADLATLDQLCSVSTTTLGEVLIREPGIVGVAFLVTCHRFEVYLQVDPDTGGSSPTGVGSHTGVGSDTVDAVLCAVAQASGVDIGRVLASTRIHVDQSAAEQLFAVTSGLESVVIGEEEICTQVRRALVQARKRGTTSGELEQLFQSAIHTSRQVRNATTINRAGHSLVTLALDLATVRGTRWPTASVLVVGTGRYAAATVQALRRVGAEDIAVHSPSGRADAFAAKHGLTPRDDLAAAITHASVVLTCTHGEPLGVDPFDCGHPLRVIDLGLPRNVDPAVGALVGVDLLNLATIGRQASPVQVSGQLNARRLVRSAAADFLTGLTAGPLVTALRTHVFSVLEGTAAAGDTGHPGADLELTRRRLGQALLHRPSQQIRDLVRQGRLAEAVAALEMWGVEVPQVRTALTQPESPTTAPMTMIAGGTIPSEVMAPSS